MGLAAGVAGLAAGFLRPKPSVSVSPTTWKADPDAGIPYAMGRTFVAGQITKRSVWDKDNKWQEIQTVYSLGPVASFEGLYVDRKLTGVGAGGVVAIADRGKMLAFTQRGLCPEPVAFGAPAAPGFSAQWKLSGLAASSIQLSYDVKGGTTFTTEPQCGYVIKGVTAYDPRKDSSYPGGSGTQRAGDETTWTWSDNPALHALTWLIGRRQNGKLVMGVGMALAGILTAQFVEAANIADANGWKAGGVVSSTDDKWNVLKQMLQAGGAEPVRLGAQLGCLVNTPRVSLASIGVGDVVGEASVQATQAIRDRINAVVPRCRFEEQGWEIDSASPVVVDDYVAFDGGQRRKEVEYSLVQCFAGQQPTQAVQLARYDVENAREFGPISLPLKLRWMGYRPGDVVTVNLPELGLNAQDVLILSRSLSPQDGIVTITARSETAGKHPFALGQTGTPPPTPSVSGPALVSTPAASAWTLIGGQIEANGTTKPVLQVTGSADSDAIDAIVFEYREAAGTQANDANWVGVSSQPPSCQQLTITGCKDQTAYQVAVSYRRNGNAGGRLILGPATAGQTSVPWQAGVTGPGKPEDNATVGAPTGTPFGGRTVDDVIAQLHDIDGDIAQLQQDVQDGTSPDLTNLRNDVNQAKSDLSSLTQTVSSQGTKIGQNSSAITTEVGNRTTADSALSGRIDTVSSNVGAVSGRVTDEGIARASADSALANRTSVVEATTRAGAPNLIVNGDFGDGFRGWTVDSGSWGVIYGYPIGPFAQAGGSSGAHFYQDVTAYPGYAYSLSFEADPDNGTAGGFCYFQFLNSSGSSIGNGANISTDSWTRVASVPFTAPSGTAKIRIHVQKNANNATFRTTRIQLQQDAATGWAPDASLWSTAARITTEESARATADSALATRATNVEATVYAPNSGVAAAHARISDEVTSRVSAVSAVSSQVNTLTASIATLSSPNLIANGQFLNGLSGWTAFGGASFTVVSQYTPVFAQTTSRTTGSGLYTDVTGIVPGKNYCFGFASSNDSGDNLGYMAVQWFNSSNSMIRQDNGANKGGFDWDDRFSSGPFVAPSGAVLARVVWYTFGNGTGYRRISQLQFQQSDSPTAYSDAASLQGLQAQVTNQSAAIADIQKNKLAAYWQVAATAGTASASISAVAQSGGTTYSAIEIIASQFTVKTGGSSKPIFGVTGSTVFINGSLVVTDSIVDNAVGVFATANTGNNLYQGDGASGNYVPPGGAGGTGGGGGGGGYNGGSIP